MSRLSALLLVLLGTTAIAHAAPWKPFTPVKNVCPSCKGGPAYDRIVLKDGREVFAHLLTENDDFLVLERLGELRALHKNELGTVSKNAAVDRPTGYGDQILLKDGTLLAGTLKDSDQDDRFLILVPPQKDPQIAPKNVVDVVYKAGKVVFKNK